MAIIKWDGMSWPSHLPDWVEVGSGTLDGPSNTGRDTGISVNLRSTRIDGSGHEIRLPLGTSADTTRVGVAFEATSTSTWDSAVGALFKLLSGGTGGTEVLTITSTGNGGSLQLRQGGRTGTVLATLSGVTCDQNWHYLEVAVARGAGTVTIHVDNASSVTGQAVTGIDLADTLALCAHDTTGDLLFDDLIVSDSTGGSYTTRLGPIGIGHLVPQSTPSSPWADMAGGSTIGNWSTSTSGQQTTSTASATLTMEDPAIAGASGPAAVRIGAICQAIGAGVTIAVGQPGDVSSPVTLSPTPQVVTRLLTAPGGQWSAGEVAAMTAQVDAVIP